MKHIKRGRGPSFMGGIANVFAALFGLIWTAVAPGFMKLFGILFIGMAVVNAVYNFKNAAGKERYSEFDIVDSREEPDPLNARFGVQQEQPDAFCPYCGAGVEGDFEFCPKCGRKLP